MARVLPLLTLLVVALPWQVQAAVPTTPEGLLSYLESVYSQEDVAAYEALLTSDFRHVASNGQSWDARSELQGARSLFGAASAQLSFVRDFCIHSGPQSGSWIVEKIPVVWRVTEKDGDIITANNTVSLVIRDDGGRLLLAEWQDWE